MPRQIGSLDKTGSPRLKVSISGVLSQTPQEFEVIIDTGFTGFISMPLVQAFHLGLPLIGTAGVVLADGTKAYKLTALGKAHLETEEEIGVIILEPSSSDVLLGMDFLRTFNKVLMVHPHHPFVVLEDCKVVDEVLEAIKKKGDTSS